MFVFIYRLLLIIYDTIFLKTRHCNKPTLITKTEYKIVKTMTINFIEFEVVFKINESQKYTICHIFNNTTILYL